MKNLVKNFVKDLFIVSSKRCKKYKNKNLMEHNFDRKTFFALIKKMPTRYPLWLNIQVVS